MNDDHDEAEPTITLRARDYYMITVLRTYAELARLDKDDRLVEAIEALIRRVCRWQIENTPRKPDLQEFL